MKERQEHQPTEHELVFEALYGYPLRLAKQIVDQNIFDDAMNNEIRQFHQDRIDFVNEILKERDERTGKLQITSRSVE